MPTTTPAAKRGKLKEAQRVCDRVIQMVENERTDGCECFGEFLGEFEAAAGSLIDALQALNQPLGDRLEYFRDFLVPDNSAQPFTGLGLPLDWKRGWPETDENLRSQWLGHMRDLRDALTNIKPTRSRKPGAGRPKTDATVKLEEQVKTFYACKGDRLAKEGMRGPDVLALLKALTATDILRGINENNNHPYPLHGPESEPIKKQVKRSSAWRCLHEAQLPARSDEEPANREVRDWQWALEIGLPPGRNY